MLLLVMASWPKSKLRTNKTMTPLQNQNDFPTWALVKSAFSAIRNTPGATPTKALLDIGSLVGHANHGYRAELNKRGNFTPVTPTSANVVYTTWSDSAKLDKGLPLAIRLAYAGTDESSNAQWRAGIYAALRQTGLEVESTDFGFYVLNQGNPYVPATVAPAPVVPFGQFIEPVQVQVEPATEATVPVVEVIDEPTVPVETFIDEPATVETSGLVGPIVKGNRKRK